MTEQQADDLMLQIMLWEIAEDNQHSANCLGALTALCRHRDWVVYEELYNTYLNIEWEGDKTLYNPELQAKFMEMQTWGING